MAICNHLAPNGEKSALYDALAQVYGPDKAHDYWSAIRTDQFLLSDDWIDNIDDALMEHLDHNGEPSMSWVEEKLGITRPVIKEEKVYDKKMDRNLEPEKGMRMGNQTRNSEEVMINKIKSIYSEALANPDTLYNITYENKSDKFKYDSGYSARELANLFDHGDIPENIKFNESFQRLINNSSRRILENLPRLPSDLINRDEVAITYLADKILLPKYSREGKLTGYFSATEQQDIVDSALYATHQFLLRDPNTGANAVLRTFKGFESMALRDPSSNFSYIHDQRVRVAEQLLDQMSNLGYDINRKARNLILKAVDSLGDIQGKDSKLEEAKTQYSDLETAAEDRNGNLLESQGHGLSDWGEVSFEHDPKDTASSRMKMFIAMQPDMDRAIYNISKDGIKIDKIPTDPKEFRKLADQVNRRGFYMDDVKQEEKLKGLLSDTHPILPKKNFMGLPKLVDFESTFQDILETLADSSTHDYDLYKQTMLSTGRPNLINLVQQLDNADQQIRNEFSRLVSMQYTNFTMMLFNKTTDDKGNDSYVLRPIVSNRYSQRNTIVKNWRENQKLSEIMKVNEVGQRVIDVDRAKNKWIPSLNAIQKFDWSDPKQLEKGKRFMQDVFKLSGVELSDKMMDSLFNKMESYTKGTSVAGGIGRQFSITQDGKPAGIFSAFIMKMAGLSEEADINSVTDTKADLESRAEMNNPLFTENTTMQILSKVSAAFTPTLHSGTSRSSEGKSIWDYSMHTKLSHQIVDLKQNFEEFKSRYEGVDIATDNFLLSELATRPQYKDRIKLMYMDGMKPQWGKRGTTRGNMSDREQMLMSVALFQNQGNGFSSIPQVHYMSLTHSDKTTSPIMMNMPKFDVGSDLRTPKEIVGNIGSVMYNIFKSEHNRIVNQKTIDFNDARYNKGKSLFFFLPDFNKEAMSKMVEKSFLSDREFKSIWMNGDSLTKHIGKEELQTINKILDKVVNDRVENTLDSWRKNGLIDGERNMFDKKYVSKLREKLGDVSKDDLHRYAAKDYALNYFVHNISMSQLFFGDPAMTFKKGKTDLESVDNTLKEYSKRLAKDIAPGLDPYFRPQDKQFNSITLKDHEQTEKYLDNLKRIASAYHNVNATDAQEFTTVGEHLKVMYANGVISTKTFEQMMQIVEANKGKYYEFTNPDHLSVIMQPVKPVYTGQRNAQDGAMLEDYIKSSSIPLYPPALAGLDLDGLRTLMEERGIDRAPFESAKKIGSPNEPVPFFSSTGKFIMPSDDVIQKGTQTLDRSGFRIQQEVPYDETKEAIKTVSQMNKLITEGINGLDGFTMPGHDRSYSGKEMRQMKEDIRKRMIGSQFNDFKKEWGIDDKGRIQDKSVVYDKLLNLAGNDRLTDNERISLSSRDSNGNLHIPLQYNTAADSLEAMLMSMVKDIGQVKMPGKSFVQVSSAGWTFKSESSLDTSKVVWAESYDGSPLRTTRVNSEGKVQPAQVLIPFNFMGSDGSPLKIEDFTRDVNGKKVIDTSKVPQELLHLIGARIPNQGHSSMAAMEVVGFLPKNMGDAVVVPAGFTKQMGADFDVDKLYTYRQSYTHNVSTNTFSQDKEGMAGHQSDYFDVHWSILTHPDMAEKILNPLDKPDLKEENNVLRGPKADSYNYFDHLTQLENFQNGKDAKMLVALTSLSVTFNSVIQDKNLHYSRDEVKFTESGQPYIERVRDYIDIKDEHTGKTLRLTNLSGNGTSHYTGKDAGDIPNDGSSTRTKADNQSTIQSAAVDNAKDRALDNLNITPDTYKAISALMQMETEDGQAVNLKYGTRLLTQPIIKEFAEEMKKGNDSLSSTYDPDLKNTVVNRLREKYGADLNQAEEEPILFDPQTLLKAENMAPGSKDFARHQLAALDLFDKLYDIGERKSQLQSLFSQDTQGAGPNILTALDKSDKLTRLDQSPIDKASGIFSTDDNKTTEQGYTAQATTGVAVNVLTQLLPYDKYDPLIKSLTAFSGKSSMSLDNQRDVLRAVRSFTYNSGQHWWKDATGERARLFYSKGDDISLARRVEEAKRSWGKDNYFLQRLDPVIGDTTTSPDFLEYQAASVGRIDESNNDRAWTEMLMSKDENQRRLGEDLMRYALLTGGVQDQNSFVKFVPSAYIANTDFGNMLKEKGERYTEPSTDGTSGVLTDMLGFLPQYIQHYPERAFNVGRDVFGDIPAEQNYPESFPFDYDDPKQKGLATDDGLREFISYRSPSENKWILYRNTGTDAGVNYYTRVDTLGNQYTDEYDGEHNGLKRSLFTENRSMAENIPAMPPVGALHDYIDNNYRKGSHYEQLNVKEGTGRKHMNETLESIRDNEDVPNQLRSVASFLRGAGNLDLPGMKIGIKFDKSTPYGGYTMASGEINLNPRTTSIAQAAETTLHEYIHNRLATMIYAAGYDDRFISKMDKDSKIKQSYDKRVAEFQKDFPEAIEHIRQLDKIRYEAHEALKGTMSKDQIAKVESKLNDPEIGQLEEGNEALYYGTKTLQEFVPHVMSDKAVQDFLRNIPQKKEGNLLQRIWRKITEAILGSSKEKPNDQLYDAMYHTVGLFGEYKQVGDITDALVNGTDIKVPTERSAKGLKSMMQYIYRRNIQELKDRSWFTLKQMGRANSIPGPIGKITDKLKEQLDKAYADTAKGTDEERVEAHVRYNQLRQDYNDSIRERNLSQIGIVAQHQLDWIDKILEKPTQVSASKLQGAIDAANMWGEMTEIMYGDSNGLQTTDPTLATLEQDAKIKRIRLINRSAVHNTQEALAGRMTILPSDVGADLKDVDIASAQFITLTRYKSKLQAGIGLMMRSPANNRDEQAQRTMSDLDNIEKDMKRLNIPMDMFMQKDSWGLVNRLSNQWHEHISTLEETRENALDNVAKTEGLTDKQQHDQKQKAWSQYWDGIKKAGTFVDTRIFFNEDGSKASGPHVDKALEDLGQATGDHKYAKELVDQAHEKFQQFVREKKIQREWLDSQIQLSDDEKKGKDMLSQEKLRQSHINDELSAWLNHNSPRRFLDTMSSTKGGYINDGSRWVVMAPKGDTGYYDSKYDTIQNDKKIKPIFDKYTNLIQELSSYLPPNHSDKLHPGFFPIVSNETVNSLSNMIGKIRNFDATLMSIFASTEAEEFSRLKPDEIPIMYTRATGHTRDVEDRSKDIIKVAKIFAHMALHYKFMSPVLDQVNVAESVVKEVNRQRVSGNTEGDALNNALKVIKYNKDKLIFNKPNPLEGKIDMPLWSMNPVKQAKVQKDLKDLNEKKNKLEEEIRVKQDDGNWDYEKEQKDIEKIEKQMDDINQKAKFIYASKAVDAVISANQIKALSYNPFSAFANFTFALISAHTYATGKTDFDSSHLRQAMGIATHAMKNYYTFGAGADATSRKIRSLMERSQVMSEISNTDVKANHSESHLKEALSPFNWQKSGDYYAKSATMIAMMLKKQVDVIDKNTGESSTVRLWDALDEHGKWDTEKYQDNPNWWHEDTTQQKEWNKFRDQMRGVATIVFGNQDRNAVLMAKKSMLGGLVGQFRMSWFPEGLNARFGSERFDPLLGREVKGRYRSFGTIGIMTSMVIMGRSVLDMLPGIHVDRFKGLTDKDGNTIKDIDIENMRRNFTGLAWSVSMIAAAVAVRGLLLQSHKGKKNDQEQMAAHLLLNMLIRNQQDLMMYASPSVWDTVTGNVIPATTVITDTWRAMKATNHYLFGDTHKDKHAARTWLLKLTKATPILNNINKAQYMFNRDLDSIQK